MPFGMIGSIVGGGKQASAAKSAAQTEANAANNATQLQRDEFNQQQSNISPWLDAGKTDLASLQSQMPQLTKGFDPTASGVPATFSFNPASVASDPAYQFAMQQGQQAIQRSAAARGEALGGATLKALDQFGAGTAAQYENQDYNQALQNYKTNYGNAFDTFEANQNNAFNRLASIAGVGQTANTQLGQAGQAFATAAGNNITAAGNAGAAGQIGAANAWGNAMGGFAASASRMSPFGQASSNPFSSSYWTGKGGSGGSGGFGSGGGSAGSSSDFGSGDSGWGDN